MENVGDSIEERTSAIEGEKRSLNDAIRSAQEEVGLLVAELYSQGHVAQLPLTAERITIAQGWFLQHVYEGDSWEMYRFVANGTRLGWHSYATNVTIFVTEGTLRFEARDGTVKYLDQDEPTHVEAYTSFRLVPDGKVRGLMVFSPPVSSKNYA